MSIVLITACSVETESLPPGSNASNGQVTVVVTSAGVVASGIDVVFHDQDGRAVTHMITDELGEATAEAPDNGMVTVANRTGPTGSQVDPGWLELLTVLEVEAGDRIAVELSSNGRRIDPVSIEVSLQGPFSEVAGSEHYEIHTSCGFERIVDPSQKVSIEGGCLHRPFSVYARAVDWLGCSIGFASAVGVRGDEAGDPIPVVLSEWRSDFLPVEVRFPDLMDGAPLPDVQLGPASDLPDIREASGRTGLCLPVRFPDISRDLALTVDAPGAKLVRIVPSMPVIEVFMAELLPAIGEVSVDRSDSARPVLDFIIDGDPGVADGIRGQVEWRRETATTIGQWKLFGPPSASQIRFPELPEALALYRPVHVTRADVRLLDFDHTEAYAGLRRAPSDRLSFASTSGGFETGRASYGR